MNNVNGVNTSNDVTTLNPAEMSQQDFIAAVYLERGEMLDAEVRRIIGEMDTSNQYIDTINTLIGKANVAEYGTTNYSAPTWSTNGNNVILDNGYGLNFQPDGNGGTTFTILDADGNQLIYQNQTLIPVPQGATVDALEVGIPVMSDMSFILDDGTKINFQAGTPDTPFNAQNFSGGLANISQVVITRGNQSITVNNMDSANPVISNPVIDGDANDSVPQTTTREAKNLNSFRDVYAGDRLADVIGSYASEVYGKLAVDIAAMSDEEQEALFNQFKSDGLSLNWSSFEKAQFSAFFNNGSKDYTYSQNQSYSVQAGETLLGFLSRSITDSAINYTSYFNGRNDSIIQDGGDSFSVNPFNGSNPTVDRRLEYLDLSFNFPPYTFTENVPASSENPDPQPVNVAAQPVPWVTQSYSRAYSHGTVKNNQIGYMVTEMSQMLSGMTDKEKNGLLEELKSSGLAISWNIEGLSRSYTFSPQAGETLEEFSERIINESGGNAFEVFSWRRGSSAGITSVQASLTFPAYTYDNAAVIDSSYIDEFDASFNDGYILTESGGVHNWEFNGSGTGSITETNPNDPADQVTGFFARKLAFEQELTNEFSDSIPFMTQKEIDLLTEELRISFSDASGTGNLTQEEWLALKDSLINARDNLNSNNQIQTVQLQRAMQTYNQNYEAMSNAQQKIYSLLRDIISNVK